MSLRERLKTATNTLRGVRTTDWLPLAYAEDGLSSPYPETERFTAERLRQAAANFDASAYPPPVIVGNASGPVHQVGEFGEPAGRVAAVHFDGQVLWGRLQEIVEASGRGRIEDAVSRGRTHRSLALWLNGVPSVGGARGAAIRHLAMVGGETPGQMHLPALTNYLQGALGHEVATRAAAEDNEHTVGERTIRDRDLDDTLAGAAGGHEEDGPMAETDSSLIQTAVRTALAESLGTALPAALKPLADQIAEQKTELTAVRTALAEAQVGNRTREMTAAVDALVSSGRVTPAERDSEVALLTTAKPEDATKRLAILAQRNPVTATRTVHTPAVPGAPVSPHQVANPEMITGLRTALRGLDQLAGAGSVDPASVEQLGELIKAAGGDPTRIGEALQASGFAPGGGN